MVRARIKVPHEGASISISPTVKEVKFPFVVCYTIENETITDHWLVTDQMVLMQQLGVVEAPGS